MGDRYNYPESDFTSEYELDNVANCDHRKATKIKDISNPLKIKVLNASCNLLSSFGDIQLW